MSKPHITINDKSPLLYDLVNYGLGLRFYIFSFFFFMNSDYTSLFFATFK